MATVFGVAHLDFLVLALVLCGSVLGSTVANYLAEFDLGPGC